MGRNPLIVGRQAAREPAPLELACGRRAVDEQDGRTLAHHGVSQRQAITLVGVRAVSAHQISHRFLHAHVVLFLTTNAGRSTHCFTSPIPRTPTEVYLDDYHVLP